MSLDRRVYLATALAALVGGSAVVLAAPQDPFTVPASMQSADAAVPVVWHESALAPEPVNDTASPRSGLLLVPNGEGGLGVRTPDVWPVDIRREMAVDNLLTNVGFVR